MASSLIKNINRIFLIFNIFLFIFLVYLLSKKNIISYFRPTITSSYYQERQTLFENLSPSSSDIYFLGDSLTDGCEWNELFSNPKIKNRGINGDTTEGILNRIDQLAQSKPQKIFIMIGINDLFGNVDKNTILTNYQKIIKVITDNSPKTKIYIESILPFNSEIDKTNRKINNQDISNLDNNLKNLSNNSNIFYIDLYSLFLDSSGQLNPQYTLDGIHLNGKGYIIWKNGISQYIGK
jgi:lysophospholipase L1-like esterase